MRLLWHRLAASRACFGRWFLFSFPYRQVQKTLFWRVLDFSLNLWLQVYPLQALFKLLAVLRFIIWWFGVTVFNGELLCLFERASSGNLRLELNSRQAAVQANIVCFCQFLWLLVIICELLLWLYSKLIVGQTIVRLWMNALSFFFLKKFLCLRILFFLCFFRWCMRINASLVVQSGWIWSFFNYRLESINFCCSCWDPQCLKAFGSLFGYWSLGVSSSFDRVRPWLDKLIFL